MGRAKTPSGLPDAIERREILAGNPKMRTDLGELGRRYLAAGRLSDAVDCFERTKDGARLEEVKKRAVGEDAFILVRLSKIPGITVAPDEWRRAGEAAEKAGRDRSAAIAFERAGDAARAAAAKERAAALRAELPAPKRGRGGLEIG